MKNLLNISLLITFVLTNMVPLTGIHIHKLASTLFLLLSVVHTIVYRKKLGMKRYLLLGIVVAAFASGLFGMILEQYAIILMLHKVISIASVFFLAIHIFVYHRRFGKKTLWTILGCIGVGLGAIGSVVPMLPTFPFLMLASFSFAKSSEKLHKWFTNTKLYKDNLEDYVAGRGMTWKAKIRIMITVTILMSIGFVLMGTKGILVGCMVLSCVWVLHILYFCFGVKTHS